MRRERVEVQGNVDTGALIKVMYMRDLQTYGVAQEASPRLMEIDAVVRNG